MMGEYISILEITVEELMKVTIMSMATKITRPILIANFEILIQLLGIILFLLLNKK